MTAAAGRQAQLSSSSNGKTFSNFIVYLISGTDI